jgi:DNA-binding transcriptional MerR regulator
MSYTIRKLADVSGVTVRALHYYEAAGLLSPARKKNGYRIYEEKDLLRLQQIMFFRELDFPIPEIKKILNDPSFDQAKALEDHKQLIEEKRKRLAGLVKMIDATIKRIKRETIMKDEELYKAFKENGEKYADEAKARWGDTLMYKESAKRVAKMSKEDMIAVQKAGDELMEEIAANMSKGPASSEIQKLIGKHYDGLRAFYEPNLKMYRGLADMYVADGRFTAYYEKYAKGLALFMRDAMHIYADRNE